uniref:DNA-directed RNA polymerase III subunit n=1 Tax=Trichuris muris TaxID=70415 RepID=A0A5S6QNX0_TRIMR
MGIKRGEFGSQLSLASTELYPELERKPLPVNVDSVSLQVAFERGYFLRLRQMPYYRCPRAADLHKRSNNLVFSRLPKELHPRTSVRVSTCRAKAEKAKMNSAPAFKFNALEESEPSKVKEGGDEQPVEVELEADKQEVILPDEEVDEDELEEENDYIDSYFDNGESYLDDSSADEAAF